MSHPEPTATDAPSTKRKLLRIVIAAGVTALVMLAVWAVMYKQAGAVPQSGEDWATVLLRDRLASLDDPAGDAEREFAAGTHAFQIIQVRHEGGTDLYEHPGLDAADERYPDQVVWQGTSYPVKVRRVLPQSDVTGAGHQDQTLHELGTALNDRLPVYCAAYNARLIELLAAAEPAAEAASDSETP